MATIRKRAPGQWQAQVRKRGYPLQTKTFPTRASAARWAQTVEYEITQGMFISRSKAESTTLRELLVRYLSEVTPLKKGAASETIRIKALMRHPLACRFVASIRGVDIAQYRTERLNCVSSATVRRELVILSNLFEISRKEWDIFTANPIRDVKLPPHGRPRDRRLLVSECESESEEIRLFLACAKSRNRCLHLIVRLALETAMRQSELTGLRWENIDMTRCTARLPDTKNGESRTVPLSSVAIGVLRTLSERSHGLVFGGMTPEAVKRAFARAAQRAQLFDFHFHDLRHEATTRFFERGLNIMEVASITGHKDLGMLRRYTHLRADELAKKLG